MVISGRAALNEAAATAERELGLPVQMKKVSRAAWEDATEPFVRTVKASPLVPLDLSGPEGDR